MVEAPGWRSKPSSGGAAVVLTMLVKTNGLGAAGVAVGSCWSAINYSYGNSFCNLL